MELNKCACCGNVLPNEYDGFEICDKCGWQDDPWQRDNPNNGGAANIMSLNEAKQAYKEGKKVY